MAIIIPENALGSRMATPGEKRLLTKFKEALPDDCLVWYEPQLKGARRPDLIVFSPVLGLIIYEVKDWRLEAIQKANPDSWELVFDGIAKQQKSPLRQAEEYFRLLERALEQRPELRNPTAPNKGQLKFPVAHAVAFTNIRSQRFSESPWVQLLVPEFVLFQDDIAPSSNTLANKMKGHFKAWFPPKPLDENELNALRSVLYPEIVSIQQTGERKKTEVVLDMTQEQIAKRIPGEGHTIIRGVAGSGKSLVLCAKAQLLAGEHPDWDILLTCFNKTLAKRLNAYISSFQRLGMMPARRARKINVVHFHGLAARHGAVIDFSDKKNILNNPAITKLAKHKRDKKAADMQDSLLGSLLSMKIGRLAPEHKYDAILIDEAQDFHPCWVKALVGLLKSPEGVVCLAEDPHQDIYTRSFTYEGIGLNVAGHVMNLPINYRSTLGIVASASKFVTENWAAFLKRFKVDEAKLAETTYPSLITCTDPTDIIISDIKRRISEGHEYADCAVLYPYKNCCPAGMKEQFDKAGIPFHFSDEKLSGSTNVVSFSTIFAAKGLEFENVYAIGLDVLPWDHFDTVGNDALVYVAMTRAKSNLMLFSKSETDICSKLNRCLSHATN